LPPTFVSVPMRAASTDVVSLLGCIVVGFSCVPMRMARALRVKLWLVGAGVDGVIIASLFWASSWRVSFSGCPWLLLRCGWSMSGQQLMVVVCRGDELGVHGGQQPYEVWQLLAWLGRHSCVASAARLLARSTRLREGGLTLCQGGGSGCWCNGRGLQAVCPVELVLRVTGSCGIVARERAVARQDGGPGRWCWRSDGCWLVAPKV
jgi:hypothetical protein